MSKFKPQLVRVRVMGIFLILQYPAYISHSLDMITAWIHLYTWSVNVALGWRRAEICLNKTTTPNATVTELHCVSGQIRLYSHILKLKCKLNFGGMTNQRQIQEMRRNCGIQFNCPGTSVHRCQKLDESIHLQDHIC